jgi:hypothetical protein
MLEVNRQFVKIDPMSTSKYDEWFKDLVRKFPRAEVVEDLLAQIPMQAKTRNADFFFNDRQLIGELKSLETSRMPAIQKVIDELRDKGEAPIFYHPAPVSQIIKDHPHRRKLNRQFLMEIAKRLEKDFREANGQIRDTKAAFNIPAAKGFILIMNSELQEMTLKLAWNELNRLIQRKRGNAFAYEHLDFAIYLQDVEVRERSRNYAEHPVLTVLRKDNGEITEFIDQFLRAIASAKGFDFLAHNGNASTVLDSVIPHKRFNTIMQVPLTRSQVWKARYLQKRTYRNLTDDELLGKLGQFILEEYLVLKDGKVSINMAEATREYIHETIEGLFTECELRFVDMQKLQKKMFGLLDQEIAKGEVADLIRRRRVRSNSRN